MSLCSTLIQTSWSQLSQTPLDLILHHVSVIHVHISSSICNQEGMSWHISRVAELGQARPLLTYISASCSCLFSQIFTAVRSTGLFDQACSTVVFTYIRPIQCIFPFSFLTLGVPRSILPKPPILLGIAPYILHSAPPSKAQHAIASRRSRSPYPLPRC